MKTLTYLPKVRCIEKFWAILKNRVYDNNFIVQTKAELVDRVHEFIATLPLSLFKKLFKNLKKRSRPVEKVQHGQKSLDIFSFQKSSAKPASVNNTNILKFWTLKRKMTILPTVNWIGSRKNLLKRTAWMIIYFPKGMTA